MNEAAGAVFAFFGVPGAGKSTLCVRFGELCGIPALDTDAFMTTEEVEAVLAGRYTQSMRLTNISRYAGEARRLLAAGARAVAIADGLPDDEARRALADALAPAQVVFVLVETPPASWRRRFGARDANTIPIGLAAAEAYIRDHWQQPGPDAFDERVENDDDADAIDARLQSIFERRHGLT
ncbi:MAG TPA: AAA family ATPase [Dehalococcoidia bacterium]